MKEKQENIMCEKKEMYDFEDFIIVGNKLYYSCSKYNGLFYKDLITGEVKFVGLFPNEEIDVQRLHARLVYVEGKIICVPYCAYNIGIYDINNNQFDSIGINKAGSKERYWGVEVYEHYVYMFPVFGADVLCLDLHTKCVKTIEEYKDATICKYENGENSFFGVCCFHNKLYAPVFKSRVLTEYDLLTQKVTFLEIPGDEGIVYSSITCDEKGVYLAAFNRKQILYWNPVTDEKRFFSYEKYLQTVDAEKGIIAVLGVCEKNLYLCPFNGRQSIRISLEEVQNTEICEMNYDLNVIVMCLKDKHIYTIQYQGATLLYIEEPNDGRCNVVTIDSDANKERMKTLLNLNNVIYESREMPLYRYLEFL